MYPNGDMPFAGKAMRWIWEAPGLDADIKQMNEKIMNTLKIDFDKDFSGRNPIYLRQVSAVIAISYTINLGMILLHGGSMISKLSLQTFPPKTWTVLCP